MSMTVDEARQALTQGWSHLKAAETIAARLLAETPLTAPYLDLRNAARYIQSGVIPPERKADE